MDSDTVVELVRFLVMKLERMLWTEDQIKVARVGAWVWAILGKCRDRGELSSEEVADLRQLAQIALRLKGDHHPADVDVDDEDGTVDGTAHEDESARDNTNEPDVSHSEGEVPMTGKPEEGGLRQQKLLSTTLDMIVTIVGEVYGQRDLLDARTIWLDRGNEMKTS
jgi:regulator of vacuolar morphogenesis